MDTATLDTPMGTFEFQPMVIPVLEIDNGGHCGGCIGCGGCRMLPVH